MGVQGAWQGGAGQGLTDPAALTAWKYALAITSHSARSGPADAPLDSVRLSRTQRRPLKHTHTHKCDGARILPLRISASVFVTVPPSASGAHSRAAAASASTLPPLTQRLIVSGANGAAAAAGKWSGGGGGGQMRARAGNCGQIFAPHPSRGVYVAQPHPGLYHRQL